MRTSGLIDNRTPESLRCSKYCRRQTMRTTRDEINRTKGQRKISSCRPNDSDWSGQRRPRIRRDGCCKRHLPRSRHPCQWRRRSQANLLGYLEFWRCFWSKSPDRRRSRRVRRQWMQTVTQKIICANGSQDTSSSRGEEYITPLHVDFKLIRHQLSPDHLYLRVK